jgi:hypothetical protein
VSVEAYVQILVISWGSVWKILSPFHAPVNTMVVAGKNRHEPVGLDERLHKRYVRTIVLAVFALIVANVTLISYALFINTRIGISRVAIVLERPCCINRDVYESHTWNGAAILLAEGIVGLAEPVDDLDS